MTAPSERIAAPYAAPRAREWLVIVVLAVAIVAFLPIVIYRAATLGLGDVQVFFRAAWAAWTGYPLYEVVDPHGWSYHYPPTFALLMAPFAHPLPGYPEPSWALPLPAAVGFWFALNIAAAIAAVHLWASALERWSGAKLRAGFWQPWWALRLVPFIAMLLFTGDSLSRGQPTAILGLLLVGFLILYARGARHAAALLLALAAAIKLYPILLALIPLLRRDIGALAWLVVWLLILLVGFPMLVLGFDATFDLYRVLWIERLSGVASGKLAARVAAELDPWSADMASIGSMLARVFAQPLSEPSPLPAFAMWGQNIASGALVVLLVTSAHGVAWRASGNQPDDPYAVLLTGAVLIAAFPAVLSPAQPHYFGHALPLVAVALLEYWRRRGSAVISWPVVAFGAAAWLAHIATDTQFWEPLSRLNLGTVLSLVLIAIGLRDLATRTRPAPPSRDAPPGTAVCGVR